MSGANVARARVTYREPGLPVAVELEAFSPFIPLDPDDSGLPATILRYAVKNESAARIEVELAGWVLARVAQGIAPRGWAAGRATVIPRR